MWRAHKVHKYLLELKEEGKKGIQNTIYWCRKIYVSFRTFEQRGYALFFYIFLVCVRVWQFKRSTTNFCFQNKRLNCACKRKNGREGNFLPCEPNTQRPHEYMRNHLASHFVPYFLASNIECFVSVCVIKYRNIASFWKLIKRQWYY